MKKIALSLAFVLTATFGLAACHTTSAGQLCNETKSAGTLIQAARPFTVVNGVVKVVACRQGGGATGVPLCYSVNVETHHVSGKTFASCATLFPTGTEEVEHHA